MGSKARRAIEGSLIVPKQYGLGIKRKPLGETHRVIGFDIEADSVTARPFMMGWDSGVGEKRNGGWRVLDCWEDAVRSLCRGECRESINFFYNLQYDFEGICKFLDLESCVNLYGGRDAYVTWEGKHVKDLRDADMVVGYVPKKAFSIGIGKKVYRFFDAWQFYMSSLKKAMEGNLPGETKGDFDAGLVDYDLFVSEDDYRKKVVEYCLQDSYGCRRLGELIVEGANRFVNTKEFYSSASVAEKYFRSNGLVIPRLPLKVQKYFMKSYHGGRFEMVKRGVFNDVSIIDIKSAYPYAMTLMPMIDSSCKIKWGKDVDWDCLFGAYEIECEIPEDWYLSPLAFNEKSGLYFPDGAFSGEVVDKTTLGLLEKLGLDYKVKGGVEIHQRDYEYGMKSLIEKLYRIKEDKSLPPSVRYAAKINLNGIYGKFIQLIDDVELMEVTDYSMLAGLDYTDLIDVMEKWYVRRHSGNFKTGRLFAPFYASFITGYARRMLFEKALEVGVKDVIALHTDSVICRGSRLGDLGKGLGDWELEILKGVDVSGEDVRLPVTGADVMISKCGFYEVEKGGLKKLRSRGVGKTDTIVKDEFEVKRRYGLNQAVKGDFDRMNVISSVVVKQDMNADRKRVWDEVLDKKVFEDRRFIDSMPRQLVRVVA